MFKFATLTFTSLGEPDRAVKAIKLCRCGRQLLSPRYMSMSSLIGPTPYSRDRNAESQTRYELRNSI